MKRLFYAVLLLVPVHSRPVFNDVNSYSLNGTKCTEILLSQVACPVLCTNDRSLCPIPQTPQCKPGLNLCNDLTCRPVCSNEFNLCGCLNMVPCDFSLKTNFYAFPRTMKDNLNRACSLSIYNSTFPPQNLAWNTCEAPADLKSFSIIDPFYLFQYAFLLFSICQLLIYYLYKYSIEKGIQDYQQPLNSNNEVRVLGCYKNSIVSQISKVLTLLSGLTLQLSLLFLIVDEYGAFLNLVPSGYTMFLKNQTISSLTFIVIWHITAAFFLVLHFCGKNLKHFFMIRCSVDEAEYILVKQEAPLTYSIGKLGIIKAIDAAEAKIRRFFRLNGRKELCPVKKTLSEKYKYFEYECVRYIYRDESEIFECHKTNELEHNLHHLENIVGLTSDSATNIQEVLGGNFIHVPLEGIFQSFLIELRSFYYLYQAMCLWVWFYFNYYYMGMVQVIVITLSCISKVVIARNAKKMVKSMVEFSDNCLVLRDSQWKEINTDQLVPGDILSLSDGMNIPCDVILFSGNAIIDESCLTGESTPVNKIPLKKLISEGDTSICKCEAYAGTRVIQAMPYNEGDNVTAFVTKIGIQTAKGSVLKNILYPEPLNFIFLDQLKIVFPILLLTGLIYFALTVWFVGLQTSSWFYGVFSISYALNPLLPAVLTIGQSIASKRLSKESILCLDANRISVAGKIRTMCFDKTGTLTKEGLDFEKFNWVLSNNQEFESHNKVIPVSNYPSIVLLGIATCHELAIVAGEVIGNPVDVEMFRVTNWTIQPNSAISGSFIISPPSEFELCKFVTTIRHFGFDHKRKSMTVVIQTSNKDCYVFTKGSFEAVREQCLTTTLPQHSQEYTETLAKQGNYVLGFAFKKLPFDNIEDIMTMSREEVESSMNFLGLISFKNNLKPDTAEAIGKLHQGGCSTVIITGDNPFTATHVAESCGIMRSNNSHLRVVLLGDVVDNRLVWKNLNNGAVIKNIKSILRDEDIFTEIAVTSKAFSLLEKRKELFDILRYIKVYARMNPDDKVRCVKYYTQLGTTGMCGDGGNDCGALRAAHCGIALSDSDASLVSSFTAKDRSVLSCVKILLHGRAALATSFSLYKFILTYGQITAILVTMQYYFGVLLPVPYWVFGDGISSVGFSYALAQSLPSSELSSIRPTAKPLGFRTIFSSAGQILINLIFASMSIFSLFQQSWYRCHEFESSLVDSYRWWLLGDNYESAIIGITGVFQIITIAASFNFGYQFRANWFKNYFFVIFFIVLFIAFSIICLAPPNILGCLFRINCGSPKVLQSLGYAVPWTASEYNNPLGHNVIPPKYRVFMYVYCLANTAAVIFWEYFVMAGAIGRWFKDKHHRRQDKFEKSTSSEKLFYLKDD